MCEDDDYTGSMIIRAFGRDGWVEIESLDPFEI